MIDTCRGEVRHQRSSGEKLGIRGQAEGGEILKVKQREVGYSLSSRGLCGALEIQIEWAQRSRQGYLVRS